MAAKVENLVVLIRCRRGSFGLGIGRQLLLHGNMLTTHLNRRSKSRVILTMLSAFLLLSFGHRHQDSHANLLDASTLAFLNAGGQLADICEDSEHGPETGTECPVCTLAGAFCIPSARGSGVLAPQSFQTVALVASQSQSVPNHIDYAHATRAPPLA